MTETRYHFLGLGRYLDEKVGCVAGFNHGPLFDVSDDASVH